MVEHELLTPEEAAGYLRLNPQTVYRLLRRGDLPGVKIGRQWRIRRADLDARLFAEQPPGQIEGSAAVDAGSEPVD